jgi:hypothetical protein
VAACTESWAHWERPSTLEELIPADLRLRYGITTATPTSFATPRGESSLDELSAKNTLVVPEDYNELLKFVELHKIKVDKVTKPKSDECFKAIKAWAVSRGCRVVTRNDILTVN